jgi:hypothetical protein
MSPIARKANSPAVTLVASPPFALLTERGGPLPGRVAASGGRVNLRPPHPTRTASGWTRGWTQGLRGLYGRAAFLQPRRSGW